MIGARKSAWPRPIFARHALKFVNSLYFSRPAISEAISLFLTLRVSVWGLSLNTRLSAMELDLGPNDKILEYPPTGDSRVDIYLSDLDRLHPGGWFNDRLIDLAMQLIISDLLVSSGRQSPSPTASNRACHVFGTYFYRRLFVPFIRLSLLSLNSASSLQAAYPGVKRWTKKVDIFSHEYLVIPICQSNHWFLVIVYQPARLVHFAGPLKSAKNQLPLLFVLDSMHLQHPEVPIIIKEYLISEALSKLNLTVECSADFETIYPKVPLQPPKSNDCGPYMLHFAKKFLSSLCESTASIMAQTANDWGSSDLPAVRSLLLERVLDLASVWLANRECK
ncbi:cysteine proteinase [Peniophora sp. CONT]|nr:cysteine proteinase [Peniophora sp. CONT]